MLPKSTLVTWIIVLPYLPARLVFICWQLFVLSHWLGSWADFEQLRFVPLRCSKLKQTPHFNLIRLSSRQHYQCRTVERFLQMTAVIESASSRQFNLRPDLVAVCSGAVDWFGHSTLSGCSENSISRLFADLDISVPKIT